MTRYPPIPPELFVRNRARLLDLLEPDSIALIHSNDIMPQSADGVMRFYQSSSLFYLTGVDQEETTLVLDPSAEREVDRERLFVRKTSELIRIWEGDKLTREQAAETTGIERVEWSDRLEPTLRRLTRRRGAIYLEANEHPRAARLVETRSDRFRKHCQRLYPCHDYRRLAPLLHRLREIKQPEEIERIRSACDITRAGFQRVLGFVRPGVHEYEVEAEFLHEFTVRRSNGFAYNPIVASGANACVLHYVDNHRECLDGDLVLMDVAAEYSRFNSDLTRTIPVNGRFSPRQRQVYEAVLRVFKTCRDELLRPGVDLKKYQKTIGSIVEEELLRLDLLDPDAVAKERARDGTDHEEPEESRLYRKYFMHGVSHSLGLDVHDVQDADRLIKEGMVFTVEPGIYIREEALGVRLENDILVGADENIDLMADIPIEADEIEDAMSR